MATANTAVQSRTINRGANPFAALVKQQNNALTPQSTVSRYENLNIRTISGRSNLAIQTALKNLKARLNGATYNQSHFGELVWVPINMLDIPVELQRDPELEHEANIIERYDPRIAMPVMATRLQNGRYSVWEGQQTSCVYYHLVCAGIIDPDTPIQVKAFDEDLVVPGTALQGEAVGNLGLRIVNGNGRKGMDAYHLHRSRVNGVRLYNSQFREDIQSEEIQQILEHNNMFPAKTAAAQRNQATPGMVTYISGVNTIAGHDKEDKIFNVAKTDLEWALAWHDKYYPGEKGVDGGFILAFGRLANEARTAKKPVILTPLLEADLYKLFRAKYGTPKGFHKECKDRLGKFQRENDIKESWSDSCLTPILVMDYINWGGKCALPQVSHMTTYAGI